jgi:hypothetical protein
MRTRRVLTRERLDGAVIDIEFLLIAVVQGLALTTLAVESEGVIGELEWTYWPYVLAGFILICNFWTLATTHSISFISWPYDIVHTLLYMLVAFVEVAAFAQITHPEKWFFFTFAFFAVSVFLYVWDMRIIRARRDEWQDTPARAALSAHVHDWQLGELRLVLPAALVFQGAVVLVLLLSPGLILGGGRHVWVVMAQNLFGMAYLVYAIRSFAERKGLMTAAIEEERVHLAEAAKSG